MKLSPSWEAANCAATQELATNLWSPKVHYRVHKSHAVVSILSQTMPPHHISLRSILILSTHLRLGLPSGSFLLIFPPISYTHSPSPSFLPIPSSLTWYHSNYIWRIQAMKLLIMKFPPISPHLISLRSKYSPQHLLSMFLPSYQRPSFTPIQDHRQNYDFVSCYFDGFRKQMRRQKVLDWMVASVTNILSPLNFFRMEGKEQYWVETSNRFAWLENLDGEADVNTAWETVRENIRIPAKESLCCYEVKRHKPWIDDGCSS
jgi:hypothetical protein